MTVRELAARDYARVAEIYEQGIRGNMATFTAKPHPWPVWDAAHMKICRFVAEKGGEVVGWAALSPYDSCPAYGGVAEVSVYVDSAHKGAGVGRALLETLIPASEQAGLWMLEARIVAENAASRALFALLGFREVGYRERIGYTPDGVWHNVVICERRSAVNGV